MPTDNRLNLDLRIQKLERLYVELKVNIDLIDPKKTIEFQAETILAIKALRSSIKEVKEDANRRLKAGFSVVAIILVVVQVVISLWPS